MRRGGLYATITVVLTFVVGVPLAILLVLAPAQADESCSPAATGGPPSDAAQDAIPSNLMPLYQAAEGQYGVPWNVLAAINRIETDFGRNVNVSTAGAVGWMQFMPGTWARWGVDGDDDGHEDPLNPRDAIPAAARYLRASGAPGDLRRALYAYNHAWWYVDDVLDWASRYGEHATVGEPVTLAGAGCSTVVSGPVLARLGAEADRMTALEQPYQWGGGHASFDPDGPWDCSGAVSQLLHALGMLDGAPLDSTGLMSWGRPGRGRDFTVWANPDHVFVIVERGAREGQAWGTATRDLAGKPGSGPMWHRHGTAGFSPRHFGLGQGNDA